MITGLRACKHSETGVTLSQNSEASCLPHVSIGRWEVVNKNIFIFNYIFFCPIVVMVNFLNKNTIGLNPSLLFCVEQIYPLG